MNKNQSVVLALIAAQRALVMADAKLGGTGQSGSCGFDADIPERREIAAALRVIARVVEGEALAPAEEVK